MSMNVPRGYERISTLDPQQKQMYTQLMQMLQQQLGTGNDLYNRGASHVQNLLSGSPESFAAFEAPYKRQFEEQIVPGLAERFAGQGALSSSGFQQALGQAGAGLSENLASMRSGLQMQSLPYAFSGAQQPLTNVQNLLGMQTQSLMKKEPSGSQVAIKEIGQTIVQLLPYLLMFL